MMIKYSIPKSGYIREHRQLVTMFDFHQTVKCRDVLIVLITFHLSLMTALHNQNQTAHVQAHDLLLLPTLTLKKNTSMSSI